MLELVQPITGRHAIPVNICYTYEGVSKLVQLPEEKIPFETIVAYLTSGKADTVRLGFEIPSLGHRIGSISLRYSEEKLTAEYDEFINQVLSTT